MTKHLITALAGLLFTLSSSAQHLNIFCEDGPQFHGSGGKMTGLDIDIVSEIQRRVGNNDPIQFVPWTRGLKYLDSDPNTILFSMARTKERSELYQWIGPLSETVYGFYAKADSPVTIDNLDDAKKVASIGVYRNDIRDQFLTQQGFTNLDRADNSSSNLKKLMAGRVSIIASTALAVKVESKRGGYTEKDVKFLYAFLKLPVYIAASATTDPKVVASWNAALESMKKDGTLKNIFKKYASDDNVPAAGAVTN